MNRGGAALRSGPQRSSRERRGRLGEKSAGLHPMDEDEDNEPSES